MMLRSLTTLAVLGAAKATLTAALIFSLGCATAPSVEQERAEGQRIEQEVRNQAQLLNDHVVDAYVDAIGDKLLRAAGPQPLDYSFTVIENPNLNAFAIAGGAIFIHTGTLLKARNVSELAGVMAHEIGHVAKRHVAQNMARAKNANLFRRTLVQGVAIGTGNRNIANAASVLSGLSAVAYINRFSREAEREADAFAVGLLPLAGYHPTGVADLFETLLNEKSHGSGLSFLNNHPAPRERLNATRALITQGELPPNLRVDDNGRLELIQYRIRCLSGELMSGPCSRWR